LTGSLPSGHDPAKPWAEKKDSNKSSSSFFILIVYINFELLKVQVSFDV